MKAILYTDGGARGNPGPAGIGLVLATPDGEVIGEIAESIGVATNNVAEYRALIAGLEMAAGRGVKELEVRVDSELLVHQLKGDWKIKKDHLRTLAVRARGLMNTFDVATIEHVTRDRNADADKLANQGMDAAALDAETGGPQDTLFA